MSLHHPRQSLVSGSPELVTEASGKCPLSPGPSVCHHTVPPSLSCPLLHIEPLPHWLPCCPLLQSSVPPWDLELAVLSFLKHRVKCRDSGARLCHILAGGPGQFPHPLCASVSSLHDGVDNSTYVPDCKDYRI